MVTIRVPATSANLGPGFDCLGLALRLYFQAEAAPLPEGQLNITGCPAPFRGPDNLVYRAFLHALERLGEKPMGLRLHVDSAIPLARGLGSSAAAAACGAAAAFALTGNATDKNALFQLAAQLEGHGDNAAPAVHGGLMAVSPKGEALLAAPLPLHAAWRFTALIPDQELSTTASRQALPGRVSIRDATFNVGRAVLAAKALASADLPLLRQALEDRLHQPYRLPLINGGQQVWQQAERLGAAVYLSGAGPTLMCLHLDDLSPALAARLPAGWQALPLTADQQGILIQ